MAVVYANPGIPNDWDLADFNSFRLDQTSNYSRNGVFSFCTSNASANQYIKSIPAAGEYYMAGYVYCSFSLAASLMGFNNGSTNLMRLTWVGATQPMYVTIDGGGTHIADGGSARLYVGSAAFIEIYYKRHSTQGIVKVWVNGVLEIDFAGNTGSEATNITAAVWRCYYTYFYFSDMFVSTTRINDLNIGFLDADKSRVPTYAETSIVSSTGCNQDLNTWGSTGSSTGFSYIANDPIKVAGQITKISMRFYATGTIKCAVFTKAATSNDFTIKSYVTLTAAATGMLTFTAPIDFTAINVTEGDYFGFTPDAVATARIYNGGDNPPSSASMGWFNYAGDASPAGSHLFSYSASNNVYAATAYITNISGADSYKIFPSFDKLKTQPFYLPITESAYTNTLDAKLSTFLNYRSLSASLQLGRIASVIAIPRSGYAGNPNVKTLGVFFRQNNTESTVTEKPLSTTFGQTMLLYDTNPVTGQPWTLSDLASTQLCFKART